MLSILLGRKLPVILRRFITEAWSENTLQWISSKEKQFGKIGRVVEVLVLDFMKYVRHHHHELLFVGRKQAGANIQGNLRGKPQQISWNNENQVS